MLMDGTLKIHDGKAVTDVPLVAGQSYMRQSGVEHDVMNGSSHPIAFIEIEVKRPEALMANSRRLLSALFGIFRNLVATPSVDGVAGLLACP